MQSKSYSVLGFVTRILVLVVVALVTLYAYEAASEWLQYVHTLAPAVSR
jgi:hypothetical protein